jgi:hypothetical protein
VSEICRNISDIYADVVDIWAIVVGAYHVFSHNDKYIVIVIPRQDVIATFCQQTRYLLDRSWLF